MRIALPLLLLLATADAPAGPGEDWVGPLREVWPAPVVAVDHQERHVLLAEKSSQTLFLFRFSPEGSELVSRYPCTTGKNDGDKSIVGDEKTPEGVYFFTSYIDGKKLPPLYGAGAFPMDYPNYFDRREGRKGSGIWLHGVETDDRVYIAKDTRGCVAVSNSDFRSLQELIRLEQTPLLVVEELEWLDSGDAERRREEIGRLVDEWRHAWEEKEMDAYLSHYDPEFRGEGLDLDGWEKRKRRFAQLYRTIRVRMDGLEGYQEDSDRILLTFRQDYASDGHQDVGRKKLWLRRGGDGWRIFGEEWKEWRDVENVALALLPGPPPPEPEPAPAVTTPAAPPAAAASPAPQPLAPGERVTGRGFSVAELTSEEVQGMLRVSFLLRGERQGGDVRSGYMTLAVLDEAGRLVGRHPEGVAFRHGAPREYRQGEWFTTRGLRHTDAMIPLAGGAPDRLRVIVHDRSGELLLAEELPL